MPQKRTGYQCYLSIGDTSGNLDQWLGIVEGWTEGATKNFADTTLLADAWQTFAPADGDPGEVSFDVTFGPEDAEANQLYEWFYDGTKIYVQMTYYDTGDGSGTATSDEIEAYISNFNVNVAKRELVTASITLRKTGDPGIINQS